MNRAFSSFSSLPNVFCTSSQAATIAPKTCWDNAFANSVPSVSPPTQTLNLRIDIADSGRISWVPSSLDGRSVWSRLHTEWRWMTQLMWQNERCSNGIISCKIVYINGTDLENGVEEQSKQSRLQWGQQLTCLVLLEKIGIKAPQLSSVRFQMQLECMTSSYQASQHLHIALSFSNLQIKVSELRKATMTMFF